VPGLQRESRKQRVTRGKAVWMDAVNRYLGASTNVSERHVLQKYVPPRSPEWCRRALLRWVLEAFIR